MYKHILIPIDGSPTADKAIEAGIEFARGANAKVTLFTAVPEYEPPGEAELMARRAISLWDHERISRDKAQAILRPAAERYAEFAQRMSSHGRRGLSELWYGSETHAVLKHSSIPTLVYR